MFDQKQLETIQKMINDALRKRGRQHLHQGDIPPGTIKRRHLDDVVIVFGIAADRPTDSSTGVRAYFATDTDVLSLWNGDAWVSETLT